MYEAASAFECVVYSGRILLSCGSEIERIEQTVTNMADFFGFEDLSLYVLSNGYFISTKDREGHAFSKVIHVPVVRTHFGKIEAMDHLVRNLPADGNTETTHRNLVSIEEMPEYPPPVQIAASAIGSGCFCAMLGGTVQDSLVATGIGGLLWVLMLVLRKTHLSKSLDSLLGGMFVALLAIGAEQIALIDRISPVIVGSVIPLVPGVLFINSIQDLTNSDFISGSIRILDALIVTGGIALGVGLILRFKVVA